MIFSIYFFNVNEAKLLVEGQGISVPVRLKGEVGFGWFVSNKCRKGYLNSELVKLPIGEISMAQLVAQTALASKPKSRNLANAQTGFSSCTQISRSLFAAAMSKEVTTIEKELNDIKVCATAGADRARLT